MASTSELRISEVQQVRSSSVGLKNNTGTSTKSTIDGNYHRLMGEVPRRSLSTSTSTNPVDSKYLINKETNVSEVTSGLRRSLSEASPNTSDSIHPKRLKIMQTIVSNVNSDDTRNMKRINPAMMYLPKQVSLSEAVLGGGSGIVRKSSC